MKGAYRAFEIGPRNCLAQGFVMTELRVMLACIIRQFNLQLLTLSLISSFLERVYESIAVRGHIRLRKVLPTPWTIIRAE